MRSHARIIGSGEQAPLRQPGTVHKKASYPPYPQAGSAEILGG
ncbi:MAG TPA: hypothetical protein VIO13_03875 [Candidatus Dormibacteraeota bacterium]